MSEQQATDPQAALHAALSAAQADMPAVEKDAVNPHFKSRFTTLDHLIAKTRPVLNKHGLSIDQFPINGQDGVPLLRTTIRHVGGGSISGEMPLLYGKPDMQGLGAAITYGRRFAWAAALGISTDEDDDGNSAVATQVAKPAAAAGKTGTGPKMAHERQIAKVRALRGRLVKTGAFSEEVYHGVLKKEYGVEHTAELTSEAISQLITRLEAYEQQITKPADGADAAAEQQPLAQ